jgi:hypothetical protein
LRDHSRDPVAINTFRIVSRKAAKLAKKTPAAARERQAACEPTSNVFALPDSDLRATSPKGNETYGFFPFANPFFPSFPGANMKFESRRPSADGLAT